ncbi:PREDICTED: uncharacterized protein LOC109166168 [Ipomoea nil]|uniref:uncharacterized protein LOC109166168 n=1 Tax=Ipomoea nil TaxID=35883 RepID=UPI000900D7C1|nr:PREDICTED: uncharacterized protein LOC109166168 [Ipomoea nil]
MNAGAAGDGFLRGMFEGSISGHDTGIQRRPYHKNCGCALHKSRGNCHHSLKYAHVSYPIRRSWSDGCLALAAAAVDPAASQSPSPCCSPTAAVASANDSIARKRNSSMIFSIDEEDE